MLSHAEDCACAGDIDVARAARHANGAGFTINPHDQIVLDQGKGTVVLSMITAATVSSLNVTVTSSRYVLNAYRLQATLPVEVAFIAFLFKARQVITGRQSDPDCQQGQPRLNGRSCVCTRLVSVALRASAILFIRLRFIVIFTGCRTIC